jgi:hypothetical protein
LGKCYRCHKDFGLFEKKVVKVIDGQRLEFCTACPTVWEYEHRDRQIAGLLQGGNLITYFIVPRTVIKDENDKKRDLLGNLLFTNKAAIFTQNAILKTQASGTNVFMFGVIGASLIASHEHKKDLKKALDGMRQPDAATGQQETDKLLKEANGLIVIPKDTIKQIICSGGKQLVFHTTGISRAFTLEGKKNEVYSRIEPQIRYYLNTPSLPLEFQS